MAAAQAVAGHLYQSNQPAIVVMPTGSGKTGVMILAAFMMRSERALVITPSRMVRDQLADEFATLRLMHRTGALDPAPGRPIVARVRGRLATHEAWSKLEKADVVVATVQSASSYIRGIATPPPNLFDLLIVDEAHHSPAPSWNGLLDSFPAARRALFTATPFRRDQRRIVGKVIFEYPLSRAREDGAFGLLAYEPVVVTKGADADLALARAADRKLRADRAAGFTHLVMVRTSLRSRANELALLYSQHTSLKLSLVHGNTSSKKLREIVDRLSGRELDGVICVDMLGEGFDLPELKIAVLHSPHRSLGVTLQFIGRFARTGSATTGPATFLAVPSEIEGEVAKIYRPGAEWNELVEEASRRRIESEREARELIETFEDRATNSPRLDPLEPSIDIADVAPRFHVKVYDCPDGVDLDRMRTPVAGTVVLLRRSEQHNATVCVTRHSTPQRWLRDERILNVRYDLFVLFYDDASGLLFVCSSQRSNETYDAIVATVADSSAQRLTPTELSRVLRDLKNPAFFNVGMRRRSGRHESYRILSGSSADRALSRADGRNFDQGHCFGRGQDAGDDVTIGFSTASKVWAAGGALLPGFFMWCRRLGEKIRNTTPVKTGSGLDHLPLASRVDEFPNWLIAVDWHDDFYQRDDWALEVVDDDGVVLSVPIYELELTLQSQTAHEVVFCVSGPGISTTVEYTLRNRLRFFQTAPNLRSATIVDGDGNAWPIDEALQEKPPAFFTSSLARLQGDLLSGTPPAESFDVQNIAAIDWRRDGVDPLREKPKAGVVSLFDWLSSRLLGEGAEVVFNDDAAGEAADFLTLQDASAHETRVAFYHCKAANADPVPGQRVEDLYEVVGQAVKSTRLTLSSSLRRHLLSRAERSQGKRILRGTAAEIERLLAPSRSVSFAIVIVQPGIGPAPSQDQHALLAAANAFITSAGNVEPLKILGAVAATSP